MRLRRVVGAEELPHHLPRQRHRDSGRVLRDLERELSGGRQQRLRSDDAAHEASRQRFVGAEDTPRVDPFRGLADPDEPRQEPRAARLGHDAAAGEDEADARRGGRDPDVHGQGQRDAEPDGGPVDRGDHGLFHVEDPERDGAAAIAVVLSRGSAAAG